MPRFSEREREQLFDEYVRLKGEGLSDAKIARRFGVSQMTIVRWKRRFNAESLLTGVGMREPAPRFAAPILSDETNGEPGEAPSAAHPILKGAGGLSDAAEVQWLRDLASRLLLENERLKAMIAGNLPPRTTRPQSSV